MEANTFHKILVATDYTDLSENAVNTAASICQRFNAGMILYHVVEDSAMEYPRELPSLNLDYTKELKNVARLQMKHRAQKVRSDYRIDVEEVISFGLVVKEITRAVSEHKPDLVVIGTHGTSGFRKFFIGSTAYRIIRHTNVAVLTIPGEGDWSHFRSILFPVRLGSSSPENYNFIRPLIKKYKSVVHVVGLTTEPTTDNMDDVFKVEQELGKRMKEDHVVFDVVNDHCDNYADRILLAAGHKNADLIVVTASLDHTIRDFFIGPFSQQILNHAKIPVLSIIQKARVNS